MSKTEYAYWRTDKPKEAGFSHELISNDFKNCTSTYTSVDDLDSWPFPEEETIKTLYDGLQRNLKKIPNHPLFGTRRGR
jgi:hypothetical protein